MNPNQWRELKEELVSRGFDVQTKGRSKKEYLAFNNFMSVDIFRGGMSCTGSNLLFYIFNQNQDIVVESEVSDYKKILEHIDGCIEDYNTFGDLAC